MMVGYLIISLLQIYCWIMMVKEFWRSVRIWQSYGKKYSGTFFPGHDVYLSRRDCRPLAGTRCVYPWKDGQEATDPRVNLGSVMVMCVCSCMLKSTLLSFNFSQFVIVDTWPVDPSFAPTFKTYLFHKSFPPSTPYPTHRTEFTDFLADICIFLFLVFFCYSTF